ncbi:beta-galactosidase [Microbacterium sp. SS28]|uniref:beta-galactosidase n=1 Tax=Microbacterium sp. SS28 TaxID=2919948 RepID=UPI001FAAD960|nr:beta-galactosidase [Microbacterium sp. SS28]
MITPFEGEPSQRSTAGSTSVGETPAPRYSVRVSTPAPVGVAPLEMGDADSTDERVQLTTRYVTRGGEPWIPVMGEYHFSRDLPERWERELRKMKAGGINVLATYMMWIIHEEVEGRVRFDGHRDIRRFIETADRVGLKVMLRIGPWAHGEARNGGYPDWLQALPIQHRSNDPAYLELARRWYAGIEEQARGLFHTAENPAGPIIGIQVDNELYENGPHLATLREIAEDVGMQASLWTATGWGGAELPRGKVLPVYAGYSDGFWEESDTGWPAFGRMHFTYSTVRDDLTVGADLRDAPVEIDAEATLGADDPWPFVTCELGGGMALAYHRRPLVDPDDVAALALTKVGSGSAWQGYYMYHGGLQVTGELSSTQESHATGYPNDVPARDYDFSAPLGAVGAQRPHFHKLRQQHLLLDAFGSSLAPAPATIPEQLDGGPRWAVRSDGRSGFLFANNHQPAIAVLPPVPDVRFTVAFEDRSVTIPTAPMTLASGAYLAWPLRQSYGAIPALTATAQPITELATGTGTVVLFAAIDGVDVELQFEGVDASAISGATVEVDGDFVIAKPQASPGIGCEVTVGSTTLVFLDPETAAAVWRGRIDGRDSLVVWRGSGWFDDAFRVVLDQPDAVIDVVPPLEGDSLTEVPGEGTIFARYAAPEAVASVALVTGAFDAAPVAPVRRGGSSNRLSAPTDEDFDDAATVEFAVAAEALADADQAIATVEWLGDVIRAYVGDELIADQYWYGRPFEIDLAPYRDQLAELPLTLKAFAWSPATGVYVDPRVRPEVQQPTLELRSVSVQPICTAAVR